MQYVLILRGAAGPVCSSSRMRTCARAVRTHIHTHSACPASLTLRCRRPFLHAVLLLTHLNQRTVNIVVATCVFINFQDLAQQHTCTCAT